MGAFGTGFIGAVGDAAHQRAQRQHQLEMEQKKNELAFQQANLQDAMKRGGEFRPDPNDPSKQAWYNYTPADYIKQHQDYANNAAKVYGNSPPIKDIFQKAQQLVGAATNHPLWGHPGSENLPPSHGGTNPAAPMPQVAGATPPPTNPAIPPAPTGLGGMTPMLDAASATDNPGATTLGSNSASDSPSSGASAVSSPTSALASPSPASDGKSVPSGGDQTASASGPSDPSVPDQSPDQSVAAQPSSLPPSVPRGTSASTPQGLPTVNPAVPPPPSAAAPVASPSGNDMLNTHLSPFQTAQMQQNIALQNNQRQFEQSQTQQRAKVKQYEDLVHRPLTPTEIELIGGVKLPAGMLVPHYNSKVVLADNAASNGVMVDGSKPSDHSGKILQQVGQGGDGTPIYNTTDMQPKVVKEGNEMVAYNPLTMERMGALSGTPVNLGTKNTTLAPISGVVDGQTVQLPGHRTSTPITGNAPVIGSQGVTQPSGSAVPAPPGAIGTSAKAKRQAAAATADAATANPGSGPVNPSPISAPGGRVMPRGFVQMGQATPQGKAYSAVMDPYRQIFGDPDIPGIPPISKYAVLADNPEAANKIGTAVKLSMQGLDEVGDKNGGLIGMFRNLGGLPSLETSAQAGAINKAVQDLSHTEREAYDRQMQMIGTLVGLRAITSASAAQGSVRTIMNEAPMFGINVADSKEFNRRLAGFAQQMYTASAKSPVFTTADRNMFKAEAQHMAELGYGNSKTVPKPPGGGKSGGLISVSAPDGSTHSFKTQKEADNFKDLLKKQGVQ